MGVNIATKEAEAAHYVSTPTPPSLSRTFLNAKVVNTTSKLKEAVFTPVRSPTIADVPVRGAVLVRAIAHDFYIMIHILKYHHDK